jgi:hypothetical protein
MEVPQETPCVAILNKQKCHFLLLLFFLYKIREQEGRTCLAWGGVVPVREGEDVRKW